MHGNIKLRHSSVQSKAGKWGLCIQGQRPCGFTTSAVSRVFPLFSGESMNTVPHYNKLYTWVSYIWGSHRGRHIRNVMDKPDPGKTTCVIMASPLPGLQAGKFKIKVLVDLLSDKGMLSGSWMAILWLCSHMVEKVRDHDPEVKLALDEGSTQKRRMGRGF
ncbi:uncharacterized protein LOC144238502 isoform X2 [Crocuta crocuta]